MRPLVVFGDAADDLTSFQKKHPRLHFVSLKQIHSDRVVTSAEVTALAARGAVIEADAVWSQTPGEALCIRTADCLPVLFFARAQNQHVGLIAAAHAGWRGLASGILTQTVSILKANGAEEASLEAWIGPHIRRESFEVGTEVAAQLEAAYAALPSQGDVIFAHADAGKRYVHLERIAVAQLVSSGLTDTLIHRGGADTFKSLAYHSFRRDAGRAGRQISFISMS